jgi:hypothetical protein
VNLMKSDQARSWAAHRRAGLFRAGLAHRTVVAWPRPVRGDRGAASLTFLMIGMTVLLFAAALLGGGALFGARAHGFDLAQAAARAGAQQIDIGTYRASGVLRLDPPRAAKAAGQFLAAAHATGTVRVTAATVTVTATSRQRTPMLKPFGVSRVTITETASATPATDPVP